MIFNVQTPLKAILGLKALRAAFGLASPASWIGFIIKFHHSHPLLRHSREGGNPCYAGASQDLPDRAHFMDSPLWTPALAGVTALMVTLMLALPTYADDENVSVGKEIQISATPIELNADNSQQKIIGKLKYIKGYHLSSDDEDFGGISSFARGLDYYHAITDSGFHILLSLDLFPIAPSIKAYKIKLPGLPTNIRKKIAGDSEAITPIFWTHSTVYLAISFEQNHRIIAFDQYAKVQDPLRIKTLQTNTEYFEKGILPLPVEINQLQANGGLETMEALSDGRLLLMAEHPTLKSKQHFGWIGSAPKDNPLDFRYITRLIAPPKGYSPTDATELPNGDILVLLRRFTPADGVSAKFWRIEKSMLDESGPITGEVIATLKPPLSVDNMEGIAVIDISESGNPIIAVISDDNFNSFQRTLLLIFEVMD